VQALIFGREHRPPLSIGNIVSITSIDALRWSVAPVSRPVNASEVTPPQYRVSRRWQLRRRCTSASTCSTSPAPFQTASHAERQKVRAACAEGQAQANSSPWSDALPTA